MRFRRAGLLEEGVGGVGEDGRRGGEEGCGEFGVGVGGGFAALLDPGERPADFPALVGGEVRGVRAGAGEEGLEAVLDHVLGAVRQGFAAHQRPPPPLRQHELQDRLVLPRQPLPVFFSWVQVVEPLLPALLAAAEEALPRLLVEPVRNLVPPVQQLAILEEGTEQRALLLGPRADAFLGVSGEEFAGLEVEEGGVFGGEVVLDGEPVTLRELFYRQIQEERLNNEDPVEESQLVFEPGLFGFLGTGFVMSESAGVNGGYFGEREPIEDSNSDAVAPAGRPQPLFVVCLP